MAESSVQQQVQAFYNAVGWKQIGPGIYQNARYEDLRPVSRAYVHACHVRFGRHLPAAGRLFLDAGSGPIQYPEYLEYSRGFERRVCLDISRLALVEARQRIGEHGWFVVGDIARLPFRSEAFDSAATLHTIHHLPAVEQELAFADLVRCLAPGGRLGAVYSWGERSGIVRLSRPLVWAAERARSLVRSLLRSGRAPSASAGEVAALLRSPGSFTYKHDYGWAASHLARLGEVSIVVWRSVSTAMLRSLVHPLTLGRLGLRALYLLEDLAPRFFGRHGAYSTILITKPGAGSLAPAGERR